MTKHSGSLCRRVWLMAGTHFLVAAPVSMFGRENTQNPNPCEISSVTVLLPKVSSLKLPKTDTLSSSEWVLQHTYMHFAGVNTGRLYHPPSSEPAEPKFHGPRTQTLASSTQSAAESVPKEDGGFLVQKNTCLPHLVLDGSYQRGVARFLRGHLYC